MTYTLTEESDDDFSSVGSESLSQESSLEGREIGNGKENKYGHGSKIRMRRTLKIKGMRRRSTAQGDSYRLFRPFRVQE